MMDSNQMCAFFVPSFVFLQRYKVSFNGEVT